MGCCQNDPKTRQKPQIKRADTYVPANCLTVATLNYCGIMNSPFQFYCYDFEKELKQIGTIFVSILPLYFEGFDQGSFKFDMGKIDAKMRYRYSPMFELRAGIRKDNTFMSKEEFEKKWQIKFQEEKSKIKIDYVDQQILNTKLYDIAMLHSLLRYVYSIDELREAEGRSAEEYLNKLGPLFNLSFLDADKKCMKVQANLKRVQADIFCFQEYSQTFLQAIKATGEFYIQTESSKDTMIAVKKQTFKSEPRNTQEFIDQQIGKDLWSILNWNDHTSLMVVDSYIIISAHLGSKDYENVVHVKELKQALPELKAKFPKLDIILAGDLNSFLEPFAQEFNLFPNNKETITTVKKRTFTQGQYSKADKTVKESKDKIITTLKILKGKVSYISGQEPSKETLVPTDEHPFDHFVVVGYLEKREGSR